MQKSNTYFPNKYVMRRASRRFRIMRNGATAITPTRLDDMQLAAIEEARMAQLYADTAREAANQPNAAVWQFCYMRHPEVRHRPEFIARVKAEADAFEDKWREFIGPRRGQNGAD